MCRAIDVAAYILNEKGRLSGYQLQKLLNYCQAWCLVTQDRPLFPEAIRAWEHGPVVYEVARAHRGRRSVVARDIDADPLALSAEARVLVDAVLETYSGMSGDEPAALSHSELPWRESYNGQTGIASSIIPVDLIKSYYSDLMCGDSDVAESHHVPRFPVSPKIVVSDDDFEWLESIL